MQTALLIFIALFAAAIGFFLGLFLLSLDSPLLKGLFKKDPSAEETPSPDLDQGPPPAITASDQKKPSPDARLILQIWKEEGQPPVYDLAGKYIAKEELPREIINLITVTETAPPPAEQPAPTPPLPDLPAVPQPVEDEEEVGEAEVKMLSVVDEVNDILQKKLHGSPLAGKGIHLMENHNQEIRFWVGLNSYNDVDEIPDEDVRRIINESVREWEQSRA